MVSKISTSEKHLIRVCFPVLLITAVRKELIERIDSGLPILTLGDVVREAIEEWNHSTHPQKKQAVRFRPDESGCENKSKTSFRISDESYRKLTTNKYERENLSGSSKSYSELINEAVVRWLKKHAISSEVKEMITDNFENVPTKSKPRRKPRKKSAKVVK